MLKIQNIIKKKQKINAPDFGNLSIGKIQRKYNIGFSYAQNIMNALFASGYVGEENGYSPRILLRPEENAFQFIEENFASYRPAEYDLYHGKEYTGGMNDCLNRKSIADFDDMEGHDFECFCAELLKKNGFRNVEVTKGSGDQGIDIIAYKEDVKYGIQCKRYSSDVGNKAVQEAFSGKTFYNCHLAVVISNQNFTPSAKELAERNGVLLWGREKIEMLMSNYK